MADNIELLMSFGLTRQEGKIYVLLLTEGALSGYEAAKRSGISRSNAYGALAGLVDKGAAYVLEEQSVRYEAVPVREFCANKLHFLSEAAQTLEQQISKESGPSENYITIRGRRHVEDKFRNMLLVTKERVYLSVSTEIVELFREELETLILQGKKVVLLTGADCPVEGALHYVKEHMDNQFRLISDSRYAMTGEIQDETHTTSLFSANPNLVRLLKEALANDIQLIKIKTNGGL